MMTRIIKKLPVPIAGLMLALATMGNLVAAYGSVYKNIFGVLSFMIFILLILKICIDGKSVVESLKNPVVASVAPTFPMGMMVLSTYIKPYVSYIALGVWIAALCIHVGLMIYYTKTFIFRFDIRKIFPSIFVVYVGIVVGSVTAPVHNAVFLGQILFWFGFVAYLVLLPVAIYRVLIVKSLEEPVIPTITIFAAPASLCLTGYMSSFAEKSIGLVIFLFILSLMMLLGVLLYLPRMLSLQFYPSYSAFTFPFVISATAAQKTNLFLQNMQAGMKSLQSIADFELFIAIGLVVYVLIRYTMFLMGDLVRRKEEKVQRSI